MNNVDPDGKLSISPDSLRLAAQIFTGAATLLSIAALIIPLGLPATAVGLSIVLGAAGAGLQTYLYAKGIDSSKANLMYAFMAFPIFSFANFLSKGVVLAKWGWLRPIRSFRTLSPTQTLFESLAGAAFGARGLGIDPFYYGYPQRR